MTVNKLKIILPILLISSSAFVLFQVNKDSTNNSQDIDINNNNQQETFEKQDQDDTQINLQKLSIIPNRCRGCGKCVRIDSQHFEMKNSIATVISSTDLDSPELKLAINNCPTQAIVLE